MSFLAKRNLVVLFILVCVAGTLSCQVWRPPMGGISFVAGVLATAGHLMLLRAMLNLATGAFARPEGKVKVTLGTVCVVAAALISLPLLVLAGLAVQTHWQETLPCFLCGIGLVYLALVGWASTQL